jgi:hypothetical protein
MARQHRAMSVSDAVLPLVFGLSMFSVPAVATKLPESSRKLLARRCVLGTFRQFAGRSRVPAFTEQL